MAVTKIWPIKDSIKRVVQYAENPEKTELSDIKRVLNYAENKEKVENERTIYVTGINCRRESAFQDMVSVQERFDKSGGNVAYHAYQSFKTGEVSPKMCHRIGVELAQRMWGDGYQVLVATHFNTGTYHNHFVINSVNMWNGKKFNCNKGAYYRFRDISDDLCKEYQLTVIENPRGRTARNIYFAQKRGEPTKYNVMRESIDFAINVSVTLKDFLMVMKNEGYEIDLYRKYPTIKVRNSTKAVRMFRLGEDYTPENIERRIRQRDRVEMFQYSNGYWNERKLSKRQRPERYILKGSFTTVRRNTGLRALYFHYCYLLGVYPKSKYKKPLSPEMREAWRYIDKISEEVRFISRENISSLDDAHTFVKSANERIEELSGQRKKIYNKLRRCDDPEKTEKLKAERDALTKEIKGIRGDIKTAKRVIDRNRPMKEEMKHEEEMRDGLRPPYKNKNRKRDYER